MKSILAATALVGVAFGADCTQCSERLRDFGNEANPCGFANISLYAVSSNKFDFPSFYDGPTLLRQDISSVGDCVRLCADYDCDAYYYEFEEGVHECFLKDLYDEKRCNVLSDAPIEGCGENTGECYAGFKEFTAGQDFGGSNAPDGCGFAPILTIAVDAGPDYDGFPGFFNGPKLTGAAIDGPFSCSNFASLAGGYAFAYEFQDGVHECFVKGAYNDNSCNLLSDWGGSCDGCYGGILACTGANNGNTGGKSGGGPK